MPSIVFLGEVLDQHHHHRDRKTAKAQKEDEGGKEDRVGSAGLNPAEEGNMAGVISAGVEHIEGILPSEAPAVGGLVEEQGDEVQREKHQESMQSRAHGGKNGAG